MQYQIIAFNAWEYYYYEYQKSAINEQLWQGANAYYVQNLRTKPGLKKFWPLYEHIFAEPFHSYVEGIIRDGEKTE